MFGMIWNFCFMLWCAVWAVYDFTVGTWYIGVFQVLMFCLFAFMFQVRRRNYTELKRLDRT